MSDRNITVTNINIRQSIAVLLFKLTFIDLLLACVVIGFYFLLVQGEYFELLASTNTYLFLLTFVTTGIIKIFLSVFTILQWINEYYEITPDNIIHKRGIIHKRTEIYKLSLVRSMREQNTLLGEIFNYATISLFDVRLNKYLDMYLIHNPDRYIKIIRSLLPEIETKRDRISLPFIRRGVE